MSPYLLLLVNNTSLTISQTVVYLLLQKESKIKVVDLDDFINHRVDFKVDAGREQQNKVGGTSRLLAPHTCFLMDKYN